jgi:UV DNA damage endonuclease
MRIGYPCINRTIGCKSGRTFRLKSYSEERLIATVQNNLECLFRIIRFNVAHDLRFFRITSDLIPFASHPVNQFGWREHFRKEFSDIGDYIRQNGIRISMHPDQFVVINSLDPEVFGRSLGELIYHARVLDALGLDQSAKIQVHVGGVYTGKPKSTKRFIGRFRNLPEEVARRLVIENDDRLYTLSDCLAISEEIRIPVLFDSFHHQVNSSGQTIQEAFESVVRTWDKEDGVPMVDYSSQAADSRRSNHAETLNTQDFRDFLQITQNYDFDVMLEIKDKEASALLAVELAQKAGRIPDATSPRAYR